jgi:uncharacterized protein
MVMKLDNEFTVGVPIGQAWGVLTDLELIAPCMPGAQLTGVTDGVYTGKVKIKVGPVTAEYSGTAKFAVKDEGTYRAVIEARGRDSRGNGNASAVISAQLRPNGTSTLVNISTDLTIAGRIAQFGSGMIKEVSAKLLGQFVECVEGRLGGDAAGQAEMSAAVTAGSGAGTFGSVTPGAATSGSQNGTVSSPASVSATTGNTDAKGSAGATASVSATGGAMGSGAVSGPEPAALDLMSVAGRAIYKRLVPVVAGFIVLGVIIYLIVR